MRRAVIIGFHAGLRDFALVVELKCSAKRNLDVKAGRKTPFPSRFPAMDSAK